MTHAELREERQRKNFKQGEMAKFLAGTPVSTYRKWEQGVTPVPAWVESMVAPEQMVIPGLTLPEISTMDQMARKRGITMEQLIGEFIRAGIAGKKTD